MELSPITKMGYPVAQRHSLVAQNGLEWHKMDFKHNFEKCKKYHTSFEGFCSYFLSLVLSYLSLDKDAMPKEADFINRRIFSSKRLFILSKQTYVNFRIM